MSSQEEAEPLNSSPEEVKKEPDDGQIYASMEQKKIPEFEAERGRQHLLCNEYEKAAKAFSKAIMAFEYLVRDHKLQPEEIRDMLKHTIVKLFQTKVPCYSNLTLSYFKQNMHESVVKFATCVLDNDRDNVKAFYRRGVAYKHLKRFREAKEDLRKVKALDPQMTAEIDKQFADIKKLQEQLKQKQKKIAQTMISGYVDDSAHFAVSVEPEPGCCKRLFRKLSSWCLKAAFYLKRNK